MKRFRFPLERVMQFRKLQMESEQARLEQMRARLHAVEQMEQELERQRRQAASELMAAAGEAVCGEQLASYAEFRSYGQRMALILGERRVEAEAQLTTQRQCLLEARRRYEALGRLKERARGAWTREHDREADALAAENYLAQWRRSVPD